MYPIYQFYLVVGTAERRVYPIYSDSLNKEWTQESGERFFRERLSGELSFVGPDFAYIMAQPFGTKFTLLVRISQDAGTSWADYWRGVFTLTDCKVNVDDASITVEPAPVDQYQTILAGIEKEFDIVSLKPEMAQVKLDKRPMLQVYRTGESVIGCWLGNMWWEQECEAVTDSAELSRCGFSLCASVNAVQVSGETVPDISGGVTISGAEAVRPPFTIAISGTVTLTATKQYIVDGDDEYYLYTLTLTRTGLAGGWTRTWRMNYDVGTFAGMRFELQPTGNASGVAVVNFPIFSVYARLLTDALEYGSQGTSPLPVDDMAGMAAVYERVIGYRDSDAIVVSSRKTATPTEYGLFAPGQYYQYPTTAQLGAAAFPMARNSWDDFSMWFVEPVIDIETYGVTEYVIKDAYPLAGVISKLLEQIAPGVTYADDALHSLFFAGQASPSFNYPLFITPKSNAIAAGYDTPAQKGVITLRQVFDMLRDCFRCYWYIDTANQLHIEHVKFFDNGLSYGIAGVQVDLTTLTILRNGKTWSEGTNKYSFDKQSLPARYQFAWMDNCTRLFNGLPINVISPYIEEGRVEQIQAMQFSSDVDFMRSNPGGVSKDGFALLCANTSGSSYKVAYWAVSVDDVSYKLQNGPLSFYYLALNYYPYDLPAVDYEINGARYTALGTKKPKKQSVVFPSINDPDPMRLITTPIGNGSVEKISVNLSSRKVEADLRYGAE